MMKKTYKRILAATLASILVWNTCEWQPRALAGSKVYQIEEVKALPESVLHQEVAYGTKYKDLELPDKLSMRVWTEEETSSDGEEDAADKSGGEKIATPSQISDADEKEETVRKDDLEENDTVQKASPSEMDAAEKSEASADDIAQKASPSDADETKTDKNWKEVKVRWVLDEMFSEKEKYDGKTPGVYVFDAELKNSRYELGTGFLPRIEVTVLPEEASPEITEFFKLDETIQVQNLALGAKESDIVLPDTLDVQVENLDEGDADEADAATEDDKAVDGESTEETAREEETAGDETASQYQLTGITWQLDEKQSDLPEFHGGISVQEYFDEFDEEGEPIENEEKNWAGYAEANQKYNGRTYVYTPVLPENLGEHLIGLDSEKTEKVELAEKIELPEIYVLVGEMQPMMLVANTVEVTYVSGIDGTGDNRNKPIYSIDTVDCTVLTENFNTWLPGWYVVNENVTINEDVTLSGDIHLILENEKTLTINGSISIPGGASLYIYEQESQTAYDSKVGRMNITAKNDYAFKKDGGISSAANIYFYGGKITAAGTPTAFEPSEIRLHNSNEYTRQIMPMACWEDDTAEHEKMEVESWLTNDLSAKSIRIGRCWHNLQSMDSDWNLNPMSDGKHHTRTCLYCGYRYGGNMDSIYEEACDFTTGEEWGKIDETGHYGMCVCGNVSETAEAHTEYTIPTDDGKGHTSRCIDCGYTGTGAVVEAHSYDENGECTVCGFKPVASDNNGNLYEKLNDALSTVEDGGWVQLETESESKEIQQNISFDRSGISVELRMNGYHLKQQGNPTVMVENGTLTISGEADIIQNGSNEMAASAIALRGGTLIVKNELTAKGAVTSSGTRPAIEASGGELELRGNVKLDGGLVLTGEAELSTPLTQGMFYTTSSEPDVHRVDITGSETYKGKSVSALLADGYAFAYCDKNGALTDAEGNAVTEAVLVGGQSIRKDVKIVEHTQHRFENKGNGVYECACGAICTHSFENGTCTLCGYQCQHENIDPTTYICQDCKAQFVVKVTAADSNIAYATDFASAMNAAENGTTVTLLTDTINADVVEIYDENDVGKEVILDLNGHSIQGGSGITVAQKFKMPTNEYYHGTLRIIGKGTIQAPLDVCVKGKLDLSGWTGGTIKFLSVSDRSDIGGDREAALTVGKDAGYIAELAFQNWLLGKITKTELKGGSYGKIHMWNFSNMSAELHKWLPDGYAFQKTEDGTYVEYKQQLKDEESLENVSVVKCDLHNIASDGYCKWCHAGPYVASVGGTYYADLSEALSHANGGTVKLETNIENSIDISNGTFTLDLNGKTVKEVIISGTGAPTITDSTSDMSGLLEQLSIEKDSIGAICLRDFRMKAYSNKKDTRNLNDLLPDGYGVYSNAGLGWLSLSVASVNFADEGEVIPAISGILGGKNIAIPKNSQTLPAELSFQVSDKVVSNFRGVQIKWYNVESSGTRTLLATETQYNAVKEDGSYVRNTEQKVTYETVLMNAAVGDTFNNVIAEVSIFAGAESHPIVTTILRGYSFRIDHPSIKDADITLTNANAVKDRFIMQPKSDSAEADPIQLDFDVKLGDQTLTLGTDYEVLNDSDKGADAGNYTLKIQGIGNYSGIKEFPWEILQHRLGVPQVGNIRKTYDGTSAVTPTLGNFESSENITGLSQVKMKEGKDYKIVFANFDSPDVGSGKVLTIKVELLNPNYIFEDGERTAVFAYWPEFGFDFQINKADVPDFTRDTSFTVVNDHEDIYRVDLPALPELEQPKQYGTVSYELSKIDIQNGYYTGGVEVEDGRLILPIQKNSVDTTGPIGSVEVTVKTTNYNDITLTVNLNAENKRIPVVTAPVANTLTYNGEEQPLVTAGRTTGGTLLYRLDDSDWSEQIPTAKEAGKYTVWFKVQGSAEYTDVAEQSVTVTIAEKPADIVVPDKNTSTGGSSGGRGSSAGSKQSGSVTRDSKKGNVSRERGILTGANNSTANDGYSHWMQDEHGWWLRFADNSYPKAAMRGTNGIAYAWEHINGNWWAFDENGYIKTGWMRDEDYGGWFYIDPEHGMLTGWVLIDGKWYYFHPTSDGMKGLMYAGRRTPDGYYVDENGVWDGRDRQ